MDDCGEVISKALGSVVHPTHLADLASQRTFRGLKPDLAHVEGCGTFWGLRPANAADRVQICFWALFWAQDFEALTHPSFEHCWKIATHIRLALLVVVFVSAWQRAARRLR